MKRFIRNAYLEDRDEPIDDENQMSFDQVSPDFPVADPANVSDLDKDLDALPVQNDNESDDRPSCDFCGADSAPTAELDAVTEFIRSRVQVFYSDANEWLPYDSREGGFQGIYWDSYDLLFDEIELELPNDRDGTLRKAVVNALDETTWCEYDPARLSLDDEFISDWERFTEFVKHERRFFLARRTPRTIARTGNGRRSIPSRATMHGSCAR